MSYDDNTLTNKISSLIQTQLPEFIQADHPVFNQFVRSYFQFLESAEITVSEVNNYLVQDTTSVNFVLDEDGEKVVLEDSEAKFTVGEIITGRNSGATATVLVDDVDDNKRLFVSAQSQFVIGELVTGSQSGANATVQTYRANPVQNIQQLLEYANVDATVDKFLDNFRDAFLDGIVDNLTDGVNKRKLIKSIRDLYISKGTRKGHELFFRLLFNDDAVISYPNENMLRNSDGIWTTRRIMRVQVTAGDVSELIGQIVTGQTSTATAIPVSTIGVREAFTDIVEIEIDADSQTGTFVEGETVKGISSVSDQDVSFTVYSILAGVDVSNSDEGQYYTAGQAINISSAGSQSATARINTVGTGSVDDILIDDVGSNFAVNDVINFDNSGTDGQGISAVVQVVGGAVAPEAGDVAAYGMSLTDHIVLEDATQIEANDTYHGTKIVLEDATFGNAPGSNVNERGSITDIRLITGGFGYTKLPTITSITSGSGSGAKLLPISTSGIGAVKDVEITNTGFNYSSAPTFSAFRHAVLRDITGTFNIGDALTSHSGTITAFDSARQILSINTTANLVTGNTVTTAGASATIAQIDTPTITPQVGTIAITSGEFLGERGKISSDVMRVQDSFYYQDYSYVVKVGESINTWRNAIKRTVHPAGWAVFGEVSIVSKVTAGIQAFTADDLSVPEGSFTPELASLLKTVFVRIFGRRLGTVDDGTVIRSEESFISLEVGTASVGDNLLLETGGKIISVRPNPNEGSSTILPATAALSGDRERDGTLTRVNTIFIGVVRANPQVSGSTLANLPKYAFAVEPTLTDEVASNYPGIIRKARDGANNRAYYNINQFASIRINQVSEPDGSGGFRIPELAFDTSFNVPPPGEIILTSSGATVNAFSNTFATFDDTNSTFDEDVAGSRTRQGAGSVLPSYDETGTTFDTSSLKFDNG